MKWWKIAIYSSVAWFGVALAVGLGLVWYITTHPMGPRIDEARFGKAGEMTGTMTSTGIGVIWLGLSARSNSLSRRPEGKTKRRRSSQAGRGGPRDPTCGASP
jgi:hypothetical protein